MALIYETSNFIVESHEKPEVSREEWWHIKVSPKIDVSDRSKLSPKLAIEQMRLTIIAGEAMKIAMWKQWIEIGRINYQENWNWKPHLHVHLYCRAKTAIIQKYWDPIIPGNKPEYIPLNENDINLVKSEIEKLFTEDRFSDSEWWL